MAPKLQLQAASHPEVQNHTSVALDISTWVFNKHLQLDMSKTEVLDPYTP